MNILIIGVGYVGLVSGICFAEMGHRVTFLDIDHQRIASLKQGIVPFYEPGLEEMLKRHLKSGRAIFTTDYTSSIPENRVLFIAVDTPMKSNGSADTSQIEVVSHLIAKFMQGYSVIVTKSTVPVGTTQKISKIIRHLLDEREQFFDFDIVSNPEFLKEGNAIQDFMKPDRIVIGVENARSAAIMKEIYSPFMVNHERLLVMDILSSELSKYAANAMLATRISFMNEIASFCEQVGADVNWIRKAIGSDERIGNQYLYPGAGFGGSCLPKDIQALIHQGETQKSDLPLIKAVLARNENQKKVMINKLKIYFESQDGLSNKIIGILGLSFKPDTDDMREAPSLSLIQDLIQENAKIRLFDPIALPKAQSFFKDSPQLTWCQNEMEVAKNAHALVLMTEWKQFRSLNFSELSLVMQQKVFFDGRNQYHPEEMAKKGFDYISIGRKPTYAQTHLPDSSLDLLRN